MNKSEATANFIRYALAHQDRDVFKCCGQIIIFGNDGYSTDPRSQRIAAEMCEVMPFYGIDDHEFGVSHDGHAWAIIAQDPGLADEDLKELWAELCCGWAAACKELDMPVQAVADAGVVGENDALII